MNSAAAPIQAPVAILAGGGALPSMVAQALQAEHGVAAEDIRIITFTEQPQPTALPEDLTQREYPLGEVHQIFDDLKYYGIKSVVLCGRIARPKLFSLKLDKTARRILFGDAGASAWISTVCRLMPNIGTAEQPPQLRHDNALLEAAKRELERQGITLVAPHNIVPNILAKDKNYSELSISKAQETDIELGFQALKDLAVVDVGQSIIIKNQTIIGIEAVEGTTQLISRCAPLRESGGLLIKGVKPNQNKELDVPTVGPDTLQDLAKHGYDGLVVQAGETQIIDLDQCVKVAKQHNLIFSGWRA